MTVAQLKQMVDFWCERGHGEQDIFILKDRERCELSFYENFKMGLGGAESDGIQIVAGEPISETNRTN